jgi:hypothetical protein
VYEPRKEMTRGHSDTITAAVTLGRSVPADKVLHRIGAAEQPGVVVSCRIQARLHSSPYEFKVDSTRWVERSLLTQDTARWLWYVTPKVGGTHTLVLSLRPIVKLQSESSAALVSTSGAESDVQEYEISVHVNVPWMERPQEIMSRLAATLKVAQSLVEALTLLVGALLSLGAVLGIRKRRRKSKES